MSEVLSGWKVARAVALVGVLAAPGARAEEPAGEAEGVQADVETPVAATDALGFEVTGFVDVYYGYNFNETDPLLRSFDVQHNTFSLGVAEIAFEKAPGADSRVGARIDLNFGKTADLVAAFEPEPGGPEIYKYIQQAYLSVLAGDKLTLDVGKFVTPIGAEVIESADNWNYTRSTLFGYAIPFYHTGVRATFAASEEVSLSGFALNGWNNGFETNSNKTFAVEIGRAHV